MRKNHVIWNIKVSKQVKEILDKKADIPPRIKDKTVCLMKQMEQSGPKQTKWANFSELKKTKFRNKAERYHCHLKKGKPTYVAIWKVVDKEKRIIEVEYIGTHEKAPY